LEIRTYRSLPQEAVLVRTKVFVEEQGFKNEFDEVDGSALHLVAFEDGTPIGTCRLFSSDERECLVLGRLAVLKAGRGKGVGQALVRACEKRALEQGKHRIELLAQVRAKGFYEKLGFHALDERCDDEGCPHVWMRIDL
jgi:predicted GNAT family N-acyltransferase